MTIGAYISEKKGAFLFASLKLLALKYPDGHFIFFCETPLKNIPDNCKQIAISPRPKNRLLLYYWYTFKLPAFLKRYNVSAFISDAGMLSLQTPVPQYLYFAGSISDNKSNAYFKKNFRDSLATARHIFTAEQFSMNELMEKYNIPSRRILNVYHSIPHLTSAEANTNLHEIKKHITAGCDYFLYPVSADSCSYLIHLLKAFSQLKKWQKSSMKLVLFLQKNIKEENLIPDFKNYKYREAVILISDRENIIAQFIRHSFAVIWFCSYEHVNHAFTAFQSGVPVITLQNKINASMFGDAVLYTAIPEKDAAEKMQLLYKDENLREETVQKGYKLLKKYDADASAESLRSIMMQ